MSSLSGIDGQKDRKFININYKCGKWVGVWISEFKENSKKLYCYADIISVRVF